ncbi:MAG: efflux RND transporter permease subunit [Gammaproteobacteria bacterium]|nr:efflux RND transporter permease subunit [Gammaproteobacteria bacterium]
MVNQPPLSPTLPREGGGSGNPGFIERVIAYCVHNPWLTLLFVAAAAVWGALAMLRTPLDAIPDLSDVQVIISSDWPGRSPDLVEDQITYPLTVALRSAPRVKYVRGQSMVGFSAVYVIFEDGTDIYWARSRVLEYLSTATGKLPSGVQPTLGPDATGVGWVFQYALRDTSGKNSLAALRSLQDFYLRYGLQSVAGVAEVASVGDFVKEYQVQIDPLKLRQHGLDLQAVLAALRRSNNEVGGSVIELAGYEHVIRGRGYIKSLGDIRAVVLKAGAGGVPVTVGDVAEVAEGVGLKRGVAELDGEGETVGGVVVMRYGENALNVIERVKQRLEELKPGLPAGVELVPTYDRSELIGRAIDTLKHTLIEEMLVVSAIIAVFLLHFRSALVAALSLPIAILLSFIPMEGQHQTSNIMSLGGIAIAIGAMVDAAIVIIENVSRRLEIWEHDHHATRPPRFQILVEAMQQVGPSIFFSLAIITVSFLPVFALEGTEGRLFSPLAYTKTFSMASGALLAITFIPALAALILKGRMRGAYSPLNKALVRAYTPVVQWAVRWRWAVVGAALAGVAATVPIFFKLGNEFMPPLNEGTILYMPTALPGMSVAEAAKTLQAMDERLKRFPEVERVFGKAGRSTSATDPAPLSMIETVVSLKPQEQWRPGMTWEALVAEMDAELRFPGMPNIWWMPIQTRTEMLATGIRSAIGIKVFGPDTNEIDKLGIAIEQALNDDKRTAPHTRSAFAERLRGGYFVDFDIDRAKAARYGLNVGDVQDVIEAALGGMAATETIEGRQRYAVTVRYARDFRDSPEALEQVLVTTAGGAQIPITELASIHFREGAPMLRNEDGQLLGFVLVDPKEDIGLADYVELAKAVVAERVRIPPGYRLDWAGQYTYFERAKARLQLLIPLTLFIVLLMLYFHVKDFTEVWIILLSVPGSLCGAIWLLYALDFKLSVAVWVGMIALAGLAVEMGILMMLYLNIAYREHAARGQLRSRHELTVAIMEGAALRIRPKLMTGLTILLSLVPVMWGTGTGADVMKRIAAPLVGGTASVLLMVLIVYPAVYAFWKGRALPEVVDVHSEQSR